MKRVVGIVPLVLFLSCASTKPPRYELKLPWVTGKVESNGLRVIVLPDPSTQLVEVDVRYEVGASEDPEGKAGLAHLVEHLMFQQRPGGPDTPPLFTTIPQFAVFFNAYTSWDTTHYQMLGPREHLEDMIATEAVRMYLGCETVTEEQFVREREVVRNEIRQRLGRPEAQVLYLLLADLYPEDHPYSRMVGGDDEQIASATLADACKFMKDYYVPSRATLIVAGNTTPEEVSAIVGRTFAKIPARQPAPRKPVPPIQITKKRIEHELDVEETSVHVAWTLPPRFSEHDTAAQFMIGMVTGRTAAEGDKWEFATSVSPTVLGGELAPVFVVSVSLRSESDIDEALDAVWRAARSAHRPFEGGGSEFKELQAKQAADFVYAFEDLGARTNLFGDYAQFDASGTYFGGELERIHKIDGDKIRSYIKSALDPDKATVVIVRARKGAQKGPRRAAYRFSATGEEKHDEAADVDPADARRQLPAPKSTSILTGVKKLTLANGMNVLLLPTGSHLPVMTVKLVFAVGSAHEPPGKAGLARIAGEMLNPPEGDAGIGGEIASADALGFVGAERGVDVGSDHTVFTVRGLNLYEEVLIKGLERWIKVGDYDQDSIERRAKYFRLAMKRTSVSRQYLFRRIVSQAIYGEDHPYAVTGDATEATIARIGRDDAFRWKETHFSARNATIIVTGNFDPKAAERYIRDNLGDWSGGRRDTPVAAAAAAARAGRLVIGVDDDPAVPTVQAFIGYPAPAGIDGQQAARMVLAEMLNLRMSKVREELGSSYGVYARKVSNVGPGAYLMGGTIDAERAGESLAAMRGSIDALRRGEGFEVDFVRARRTVLKRLLASSTSSVEIASRLEFISRYGLPDNYYDKLILMVAALSPEQVKMLVESELRPEGEVVVVLGPRAKVKRAFDEAGLTATRFVDE